ncbi:zinc ribbon domain-containing protein [Megasphaera hexanoica]|nr:zinc ribbon domain-containing protein [Megasphaera hexanoica]
MAYRECPGCGWWYVEDDEDYCPECGWLVPRKCPFCGHEYTGKQTYCSWCGRKISAYPEEIMADEDMACRETEYNPWIICRQCHKLSYVPDPETRICPRCHRDMYTEPPKENVGYAGCLLAGLMLMVFGTFAYLTGIKGYVVLLILLVMVWVIRKM